MALPLYPVREIPGWPNIGNEMMDYTTFGLIQEGSLSVYDVNGCSVAIVMCKLVLKLMQKERIHLFCKEKRKEFPIGHWSPCHRLTTV